MNINRALKLLRTYHNLSQYDMSKILGFNVAYICRVENGKHVPSIELLNKYSDKFNMSLSAIILLAEKIEEIENKTLSKVYINTKKVRQIMEWIANSKLERDRI